MNTIRLKGDGPCPEWAIIELQGEVTVTNLQRESLSFGSLQASSVVSQHTCCLSHNERCQGLKLFLQSPDVVDLTIGYHKLSGKRVQLKKPLVLVEKAQHQNSAGQALEYKVQLWHPGRQTYRRGLMPMQCCSQGLTGSLALQTVGVVRQKILFKTRPRALISAPQQKR